MQKLFYITNSRIPTEKAHGLQIIKMCEAFSNHDINLKLVLPTRKNKEYDNINAHDYYGVENNFDILHLKTVDPIFLLKLPKAVKPPQGTFIKLQTLFFIKSIKKFLKKQNPKDTIIYTRDQYLLSSFFKFSNKVIWEAHDLPRKKNKYIPIWKKCHRIIVLTQGLKNELVKLGIVESKILISPDAVDLEDFTKVTATKQQLRQELKLPRDKKIILYTGHLYSWKGVPTLAQAATNLDDSNQVIFVGGTSRDIANLEHQTRDQKNITVYGRVDHKLIPKFLKSADVLILPNSGKQKISSLYTSPMKLFEYMASQVPIISSDLPSLKEVLNNSNATFFQADNPKDLARQIKLVSSDLDLFSKKSQQAFKDVQQYAWDKRAKAIRGFM